MIKAIIIGVSSAIVVAAILAAIKYMNDNKDEKKVEKIFVDELNMGEIKKWFSEKLTDETIKGIVILPQKENIEKWKIKMPEQENVLIQLTYDETNDKIIDYREVGYAEISEKLRELLDTNNGTLVIEK